MAAKIPTEFECMGMVIKVEMDDLEKAEAHGLYEHGKNKITIDKKQSQQGKQSTFWHEFMHCALETLCYNKLSKDEKFVERMAQCLYQLEKTRK